MDRPISSGNLAALGARTIFARDFLWIEAKERISRAKVTVGFWSDVGDLSANVRNPDTGSVVTRNWYGSGTLIGIDDIPLVCNVTVQTISIRMSQLDELVAQAVRGYDCKQARVEVYRGLFDPYSRRMVDAAECRFVGFIDDIDIKTPAENEDGGTVLQCKSHTQEMTRANPDTRNDASQKLRSAIDNFYQDTAVVGEWQMFWGQEQGKLGKGKNKG